jgi:enamine deaminase RidA (YjgF/YER057c/UK114 family)
MNEVIRTGNAATPPPTYSQAITAGGFVFVSGTGPIDPATGATKWFPVDRCATTSPSRRQDAGTAR